MRQLKAWESTMQKIDENYVLIGLIWLVGGMGYGI
jgi:hypothetical protein